jgi:ankyrin repeat protein
MQLPNPSKNYKLSIADIINSDTLEILATREETFEKHRKSYSNNQACYTLANNILFNAATQGEDEWIKTSLSHGADINYYDAHFNGTPLYYAAYNNHSNAVNLLLSYGADIEIKYRKFATPLYTASYLGHKNIVKILLNYNANKDTKVNGKTPLQVAQENGHFDVVELLLGKESEISHDYFDML